MIVIETNLKVLPKKCNKCKYSYFNHGDRFCVVSFKDGWNQFVGNKSEYTSEEAREYIDSITD